MTDAIGDINDFAWGCLEESLTPLPENSEDSKILHHLPFVVLLPTAIVTSCFALAAKVVAYALSFFQQFVDPNVDFSAVVEDSRKWSLIQDPEARIHFTPNFLFGAATCTYQDSGAFHCPNSQWAEWEKTCLPLENRSGRSANFFQMYQTERGRQEICDRLHRLGTNSYRFSIEWSQIEPRQGEFHPEVLQIYLDLCKHLRDQGIVPMVTLHHFSEPLWFHQMGSFENEQNIAHFLNFVDQVFPALSAPYLGRPLVEYFCTINEPAIEALERYILGDFSPGVVLDFTRAGMFLKGAIKAHTLAYERFKTPDVQIGFVHQKLTMIPANFLLIPVTRYLNRLVNDVAMNCFKTGSFQLKIPFCCNIVEIEINPKADFIGLQYYVRVLAGFSGSTSAYEPMTEMPYREDSEGLYEAILIAYEAFGRRPIIVTENGISTHNDLQRTRYMLRALYAAQRAQEVIGPENFLGYYVWSLCDNSEWNRGLQPQAFGAYGLTNGVINREPKAGMEPFIRIGGGEPILA